jgi:hypothetical protein
MHSFQKSWIGLLVLGVIVVVALVPVVGQGRGTGQPPFAPRAFYLTQTTHTGGEALTACVAGYHMASLWEIFDPSNLRYESDLGRKNDDSGFGPPTELEGWIRTGGPSHGANVGGTGNCLAWTTGAGNFSGSLVRLTEHWNDPISLSRVNPWSPNATTCQFSNLVWCVQD